MASLGSLVVSLAVDTARFQGDLGRAAAIAESRMRNIKDTASRALGALTVVASAAGGALVASLKAATDRADDFRDLAAGAGVSVEAFSRLQFAASQSGVETEALGKALAKLSAAGSKNAAADLAALADQFKAMPDGAAKTAKAIEIFGERLGPGLIPLLNEGSDGLRKMAEQSDALGNTITTSTAAAADQFNDSVGVLTAGARGFGQLLAAELLPTLNGLTAQLLNSSSASSTLQGAARAAAAGIRILITAGDLLVTSFVLVGRTFGAVGAAIAAVARGDFSGAAEIVKDRFADIRTELADFETRFRTTWTETGAAVAASAPQVAAQLTMPAAMAAQKEREILRAIAQERKEALETRLNRQESLSGAEMLGLDSAKVAVDLSNLKNEVAATARSIGAASVQISEQWQYQFGEMSDAAIDRFMQLRGSAKDLVRDLIRIFLQSKLRDTITSLFGSGGSFGQGGFIGALASYFGGARASGGPVNAGRAYLVGERGPELFVPGASGGIVPNGAMGGGMVYAPTINIDSRADRQQVMSDVQRALAQNNRELMTQLTRHNSLRF